MDEPNKTLQESHTKPKIETPENTPEKSAVTVPEATRLKLLKFKKLTLRFELCDLKSKYEEVTHKRIALRRDQSRVRLKCSRLLHAFLDKVVHRKRPIEVPKKEEVEKKQDEDKKKEKEKGKDKEEEKEEEEDMIILTGDTSDRNKGKMPMDATYNSADKVFPKKPPKVPIKSVLDSSRPPLTVGSGSKFGESHKPGGFAHVGSGTVAGIGSGDSKMTTSPGGGETSACAERRLGSSYDEVQELPGIAEVGYSLSKTGLGPTQVETGCTSKMGIDNPEKSPQKKAKSESRSKRCEPRWKSPGDMLFYLNNSPEMRMEAVCALYRQETLIREKITFKLSDSHFEKITRITAFLTDGNALAPCTRTPEELEEIYNGSIAWCSWLVHTYSSQIYHIYKSDLDLFFC